MSTTSQIRFTSDHERKCYKKGLAEVARKLSTVPKKETAAERHARIIREGKAYIATRFSPDFYRKSFGVDPPAQKTTASAPSPSRKSYAAPEQPQRTFHRFKTGHGLFA